MCRRPSVMIVERYFWDPTVWKSFACMNFRQKTGSYMFGSKYLKKKDVRRIESLRFNPDATLYIELLKGYLYWDDEITYGLTKDGYHRMTDLLLARNVVCHDPDQEIRNKDRYVKIWNLASEQGFSWPGFRPERLELSQKEWDFYQYGLNNP